MLLAIGLIAGLGGVIACFVFMDMLADCRVDGRQPDPADAFLGGRSDAYWWKTYDEEGKRILGWLWMAGFVAFAGFVVVALVAISVL